MKELGPDDLSLIRCTGVLLLGFFCSSIQLYVLSPYLCFISFLYLNLYVLGMDTPIRYRFLMRTKCRKSDSLLCLSLCVDLYTSTTTKIYNVNIYFSDDDTLYLQYANMRCTVYSIHEHVSRYVSKYVNLYELDAVHIV